MALNNEDRVALLGKAKLKRIRMKTLAEDVCNCSSSWLSQYFNFKVDISEEHEQKIIDYINNH